MSEIESDLATIFAELGISHYLQGFIEQGFDSWDTILSITESNFDALGVKLGHRRKLRWKIDNSSPRNTPIEDCHMNGQKAASTTDETIDRGYPNSKRRYRRHPKPDENAPERPPSAYVIFSNRVREDLKGDNLSFTEIAKLVGEKWRDLSPEDKYPYEEQSASAKERYNDELVEYKQTGQYASYTQYLMEFRARRSDSYESTLLIHYIEVFDGIFLI